MASSSLCYSERAALDAAALGTPAQHAARQVGDVGQAGLEQDRRGVRRAAAGAAYRDDRFVLRDLLGFGRELAQRHELRAADMAEWAGELVGLAHVEHMDL